MTDNVRTAYESEVLPINSFSSGKYRYYFDEGKAPSTAQVAFIIAVGTAMTCSDYAAVSKDIVSKSPSIVIILDPNPGCMVKLDAKKFADNANELTKDLAKYIPKVNTSSIKKIAIGGHSAGGQAAVESITSGLLTFTPAAFVGLDPFEINVKKMSIPTNALVWGFEKTTCGVTVDMAAKAAYEISPKASRVFYQVKNPDEKTTHCIFTDDGCFGPLCPAKQVGFWVRQAVADSLVPFVKVLTTGSTILRDQFLAAIAAEDQLKLNLYVNGEHP
jgi:hypothetical protein